MSAPKEAKPFQRQWSVTINGPKPIRVDPLELPSIMKVEDVPEFLYQHHLRVVRRWWESSRNLMVIEVEEAAVAADISTEIDPKTNS